MNETVVFLVVAGVALIFRWLLKVGGSREDDVGPAPKSANSNPRRDESEQERVRRFLEALGMPEGSPPPAAVRPRTAPPRRLITPKQAETPRIRRRSLVQPLPPLVTVPRDDSPTGQAPAAGPPPLPVSVTVSAASPEEKPVRPPPGQPVNLARQAAQRASAQTSALALFLRDRRSLQQAIVLREVLGPPRAFASLGADRDFSASI